MDSTLLEILVVVVEKNLLNSLEICKGSVQVELSIKSSEMGY